MKKSNTVEVVDQTNNFAFQVEVRGARLFLRPKKRMLQELGCDTEESFSCVDRKQILSLGNVMWKESAKLKSCLDVRTQREIHVENNAQVMSDMQDGGAVHWDSERR